MKRTVSGILFLTLALVTVGMVRAEIKTDQFFPESTKGFFAVSDAQVLLNQWKKTEMGEILMDSEFDAFRSSFRESLEKAWIGRFGMSVEDTLKIASGEIGGGLIAAPGKTPGRAIVLDVTGKDAEVKDFLTKLIRKATEMQNGESRGEKIQVAGRTIDLTVLILPPDDKFPTARTIYYTQVGNYLIAAEQKYLIEQLTSQSGAMLSSVPGYQATMRRCLADYPNKGSEPMIRFFFLPLEFGEAIRSLRNLSEEEMRAVSPYSVLAKQGFGGIKGIGGTVDLATENFEFLLRLKTYIPEPPTYALKMFSPVDEVEIPAPDWVNVGANRTFSFNMDMLTLFNNLGPLFDDFLETPGVWEETLQSLEKDERGPKVNLKTELFAHLGPQISAFRTFRGLDEKYVAGVMIKEGKGAGIAAVMHRMFDTDPDFQKVPYENDVIWSYAPQKKSASRATGRTSSRRGRSTPPAAEAQGAERNNLPKNVFYVAGDTLFLSNDVEELKEVLALRKEGKIKPIAESSDYQLVMGLIKGFSGPGGHFFQMFSDNKEGLRVNYELLKNGKLMEGKTFTARLTQALLSVPEQKSRPKMQIDCSKLPPFSDIENRIGPSGGFARSEPDGWFFKGFSVRSSRVQ